VLWRSARIVRRQLRRSGLHSQPASANRGIAVPTAPWPGNVFPVQECSGGRAGAKSARQRSFRRRHAACPSAFWWHLQRAMLDGYCSLRGFIGISVTASCGPAWTGAHVASCALRVGRIRTVTYGSRSVSGWQTAAYLGSAACRSSAEAPGSRVWSVARWSSGQTQNVRSRKMVV